MYPKRKSLRERIREALREEIASLRTLRDLYEYMQTKHPAAVSDPFTKMIEAATKSIRDGRKWTDLDELKARHAKREERARTLNIEESLDDGYVLIAICIRVEIYAKQHNSPPEVIEIVELLHKHAHARRRL